jgi:hypothetical protein
MKLKSIIRRCVPSRIYTFASKCKVPFVIAHTQAENKQKLRGDWGKNSTIKIVFIVQRTEVFNSVRTVFEAAVKNDRCEAYLLPLPRCRNDSRELRWETYDSVVDFCRELGAGIVIESYDRKMNKFNDLGQLKPDYVFLNVPYTSQYPDEYSMDKLVSITKVCYIPYGYSTLEKHLQLIYNSNKSFVRGIDFIFASNRFEYNFVKKRFFISEIKNGKVLYNIGFPRFDLIKKEPNRNRTILWLPRWTVNIGKQGKNEQSSFLKYYSNFLRFAETHPNVNFIIRPHPLMFENFKKNGVMFDDEIDGFLQNVRQLKNVTLDSTSDYLNALNSATILLADFTSLLAEYYVSGQPIVYTGGRGDFSKYDREMLNTFYSARTWSEVQRILEALLSGDDSHKENRKRSVDRFLNVGNQCAGDAILNLLMDDFNKK